MDYMGIRNEADRRIWQLLLRMFHGQMGSGRGARVEPERWAFMRTLLRNVPTGLYVESAETWTGNPDEAFDFRTMSQAISFVEKAGLRKMELAFVSTRLCRLTEVPLEVLRWGPSVSKRWEQTV
jgi:hypothetical protein